MHHNGRVSAKQLGLRFNGSNAAHSHAGIGRLPRPPPPPPASLSPTVVRNRGRQVRGRRSSIYIRPIYRLAAAVYETCGLETSVV